MITGSQLIDLLSEKDISLQKAIGLFTSLNLPSYQKEILLQHFIEVSVTNLKNVSGEVLGETAQKVGKPEAARHYFYTMGRPIKAIAPRMAQRHKINLVTLNLDSLVIHVGNVEIHADIQHIRRLDTKNANK